MATNEAYKRGWIVPLTVGNNVAARTPVCVSKLAGVTLTATGASTTQASVLRHGVVDVTVDSACDAVTLACASVTDGQTVIFNGITFTAKTSTTTWSSRFFSIAGTDGADATLLCKAINGGQYLTLSGVTAGQTVTVDGKVFTAHGTTTTVANREFSIAGTDTQDATELVSCLTDGTYGIGSAFTVTQSSANEILIQPFTLYPTDAYPAPVISKSGAGITISTLAPPPNVIATVSSATVTLKSASTITSVTGTAPGATVTVNHSATSTMPVALGEPVYWTTPSTLNLKETATFFGKALEKVQDRKLTLASVTNGQTIVINGATFTAHTNTTTKSTRTFSIAGTDTQDADELCSCINDKVYGLVGFTATNNSGTITLAYDGDIAITGTARIGGTVTTAPGSRTIRVKLGY